MSRILYDLMSCQADKSAGEKFFYAGLAAANINNAGDAIWPAHHSGRRSAAQDDETTCSFNSYLSKAKKISLSGPDSGVVPWRCASKLDPDARPWDTEGLGVGCAAACGAEDKDGEEVTHLLVLSAVLEAHPASINAIKRNGQFDRTKSKIVAITTSRICPHKQTQDGL